MNRYLQTTRTSVWTCHWVLGSQHLEGEVQEDLNKQREYIYYCRLTNHESRTLSLDCLLKLDIGTFQFVPIRSRPKLRYYLSTVSIVSLFKTLRTCAKPRKSMIWAIGKVATKVRTRREMHWSSSCEWRQESLSCQLYSMP
jgi:hypothetical protein